MIPINKDKVEYIISVGREYREGSMAMVNEELSESHNSDTYTEHNLATVMEDRKTIEHAQDSAYNELKAAIDNLNEEEHYTLVALMWVGRGTYSPDEFDKARADAREASNEHTAEYIIETPLFPDYLEEGLSQMSDD